MSTRVNQRPTVDTDGNIVLHGRQGFSLPVSFVDETDGTPRDVVGLPIFFEVDGKLRVSLGAGATDDERVIILTDDQVASLFDGSWEFAIRDESGAVPDVPWAGTISTYGFKDQPA